MYRFPFIAAFGKNRDGASAIEFAFVAPVLLLIFAGVVDLGGALRVKFNLDSVLSAASNFTMGSAESVNSEDEATLAARIATIVASTLSEDGAVEVEVNKGLTLNYAGGETKITKNGKAADSCYCPTLDGHDMVFGNATDCGLPCADGSTAGKFVAIRASQPYTPLFGGFGLVQDGNVTARAVVRPQ